MAEVAELVGDQPVPELRVVVVDVQGSVDQRCIVPVPLCDRVFTPLIERLLGKTEHPAGHHNRHPQRGVVRGEVKDQRVHHFGLTSRDR